MTHRLLFGCLLALLTFRDLAGEDLDAIKIGAALRSSDQMYEVYKTPLSIEKDVNGTPFGFGTKLYVRRVGSKEDGVEIIENARWMAAQWCPGTHLLGVENHTDGHASVVDVFEVSISSDHVHVSRKLVFRSPENSYNRKWFIEGWDSRHRLIHLRLEQQRDATIDDEANWALGETVQHASFTIGTMELKEDVGEQAH